jgi:ElaB/YqjD/DUF883 family membrane-anchored ribosome-binding protein
MERDSNDTFSNPNATGTTGSTPSTGFGAGMSGGQTTGTADTYSADATPDAPGLTDRARDIAGDAGDKLADVGTSMRDRAGTLKHTIADALESSAERLRRQGSGATLAGATAGTADTVTEGGALTQTSQQLAGGLQGAADWIRDADLDGLKAGIEKQVKEHPGRSLAIAIGVGYLLGKAIRR